MNCPMCMSGVLEKVGEAELSKIQTGELKLPEFPVTIFVCSMSKCSHIELKAGEDILRNLNKEKRKKYQRFT